MTWSITLTVLPSAGGNTKALPLQTKLQNVKVLPKTWVAPNSRLAISDQKLKNLTLGIREQNKRTTRPQRQQLEIDLITRKI